MGKANKVKLVPKPVIKLDFGCGPHKREGFEGVDSIAFPNVDHVLDIARGNWPWKNESVLEANASHFVEHLTALERITFVNELYRVLIPGGTCLIITPHWASNRAYGDPTHQWPPVSEFWFYYLSKEWRSQNALHTDKEHLKGGFSCDFEATWGYNLRPDLLTRNQDYQMSAVTNWKEACQDTICTLKKRV